MPRESAGDRSVFEVAGRALWAEAERAPRYEQLVEDPDNETVVWHYNLSVDEYDGSYNFTGTSEGDYGSYEVEQWPEDSAYPDYFVIGDPHLNYYEGDAVIDNVSLYVPK